MIMKQKLFAFWKYGFFPFFKGGTITEFCESDYPGREYVETEEYGRRHYFKPVVILPADVGKKVLAKHKELERERDIALRALYKGFEIKLNELNKKHGLPQIKT